MSALRREMSSFEVLIAAALAFCACRPAHSEPLPPAQITAPPVACKDEGSRYQGFGGESLPDDRPSGFSGQGLLRVKPYSAFQAELQRALGVVPASLSDERAVFADPPERWFEEPEFSAVSLYDFSRLAFAGCLQHLASTPPPSELTHATADTTCSSWVTDFTGRTAAPEQVAACVEVVETLTVEEPDAVRRWAYGCTAVLASPGFMTF
jgi:hypothetical protein